MKTIAFAAALAMTGVSAVAEDGNVSTGVSTLGLVVLEGSAKISDRFEARAFGIGGLSYAGSSNFDVNGVPYTIKGEASLGGFGVLADYYPTRLGWRLSAGVFYSTSGMKANFTGPQNFAGEVAFKRQVAPMLTTGYRHKFSNNLTLAADAGAIFSGFQASTNSTLAPVLTEVQKINAELNKVNVVPYVSLTVGYSF